MKQCIINIPSNDFTCHTQEEVLKNDAELVTSFEDLLDKIAKLAFANPNILLFYRGQSKDFKVGIGNSERTSLLPTIYRKLSSSNELQIRWRKLCNAESILYAKLKSTSSYKFKSVIRKKIVLWSILQHYEVTETPLIDVTQSLRVACSFAAMENKSEYAYIYIIGLPYYTNRISVNSEEYLTNVRLLSIAPPDAKRPYLQEGFLVGEDEFDNPSRGNKDEFDLSRRLIYKFKIPVDVLNEGGFLLTKEKLLPQDDPIALICEEVKNEMNKQTYAHNEYNVDAIVLTAFITTWQKIESVLTTYFIHRDSTGKYNLMQAIGAITDKQLADEINSIRIIRNQIVHGNYNKPIEQEIINRAENAYNGLEEYINRHYKSINI